MDYEKKYKNLVEAVKQLQKANPSDEGIRNWVNDNLPELRESEDEEIRKELIRINEEQLDVINAYSLGIKFPKGTTHIPSECFFDVMRSIWRHYNYSIDMEDFADIDGLGLDMDKLIGEHVFRK